MALKSIPFLDRFGPPILSGDKEFTARTKIYGRPGEILQSPFCLIEILELEEKTLAWIRDNLWRREGVTSPADFEQTWRDLHHGEFQPDRVVFLHRFRRHIPEVWV